MRTRWQWIAVLMGSSLMGFGCLQANGAPDKQPPPVPAYLREVHKLAQGCDSPFAIVELKGPQMACIRASDLPPKWKLVPRRQTPPSGTGGSGGGGKPDGTADKAGNQVAPAYQQGPSDATGATALEAPRSAVPDDEQAQRVLKRVSKKAERSRTPNRSTEASASMSGRGRVHRLPKSSSRYTASRNVHCLSRGATRRRQAARTRPWRARSSARQEGSQITS